MTIHSHPPIAEMNCYVEPDFTHCFLFPKNIPDTKPHHVLDVLFAPRERISAITSPRIPAFTTKPRIKDTSSLNRCDENEVKRNNYLLPQSQQIQLQNVRRKPVLYPQRYADSTYLPQSQLLLLSPGWASAERYSFCSVRSSVNPSGQCRLHRFCPYCSYHKGREVQLQFVPAYFDGNWFFMTGSYKGSLGMNSSTEAYIWLDYWTLYKESLEVMMSEKLIRGFHVVEELAVNNILEVSVLPHVHAVIDADEVDAEMVLEAVESVKTSSGDKYALMLASDVVVDPITSQESLMDRLRYIYKPINLVTAYERDWREHCGSDADQARKLNNHATDLVLGYSHINYRHAKMHSKGTLDSKSKNHIGIPASNRPQYKPQLRKLQAEHALNYIESDVALN